MQDELLYVLALQDVSGVGDVLAKQLISYCGSAEGVFKEKKGKLSKIPNIGGSLIKTLMGPAILTNAEHCINNCLKNKIQILPYYDKCYPEKLKLVDDAPLVIFYKGNKSYQSRKVIGIVGTRKATSYGRDMTAEIVKNLVSHDALVISGLAYGIDIAAHKAALKNNLPTIGVLAGGLDKVYPVAHTGIAEAIQDIGGVLTEKRPGIAPESHFFPARNRIIAGMSDAVIVVEAANKGGALITANIAYSYNREVFAVPGDLSNPYSEGCNALIRSQKANIYTRIEDLEYLLDWEKISRQKKTETLDLSQFSDQERTILAVLQAFKNGLHLDQLSWKTQISVNNVVSLLLNLEFSGFVKSLPGKVYKLTSA